MTRSELFAESSVRVWRTGTRGTSAPSRSSRRWQAWCWQSTPRLC